MKKYIYALLHEAFFIWLLLLLDILMVVAIYIGLSFSGLSSDTNIIVTSILAAILAIGSMVAISGIGPSLKDRFATSRSKTPKNVFSPLHLSELDVLSTAKIMNLEKTRPLFSLEISQLIPKVEEILKKQNEELKTIESLKERIVELQKTISQLEEGKSELAENFTMLKNSPATSQPQEHSTLILPSATGISSHQPQADIIIKYSDGMTVYLEAKNFRKTASSRPPYRESVEFFHRILQNYGELFDAINLFYKYFNLAEPDTLFNIAKLDTLSTELLYSLTKESFLFHIDKNLLERINDELKRRGMHPWIAKTST